MIHTPHLKFKSAKKAGQTSMCLKFDTDIHKKVSTHV